MNPPSPLKYPNRDGLPLSQLSPERVNGRAGKIDDVLKPSPQTSPRRRKDESFFSPGIPQSPSLPEVSMFKDHFRMNTDVSGLVKRFEHLDVRDREAESQERRRRQEEALERAKIAREEAESELSRCREELRAQKKDYEDSKSRERKACRRVEILMDEIARAKDQYSSQSSVYEKEIRRARKEAFKSSSAVLKLQEESKQTQSECNVLRSKLDLADRKVSKSEEDRFTAQYQLVAVQEELDKLRHSLRIAEEERERWKRSLQEEDVVRIAAQGDIALPDHTMDDIDQPEITTSEPDQNAIQRLSLADIRAQMQSEMRRRIAAEDLVDFLQLECRYQCCRCSVERHLPVGQDQIGLEDMVMQDAAPSEQSRHDHLLRAESTVATLRQDATTARHTPSRLEDRLDLGQTVSTVPQDSIAMPFAHQTPSRQEDRCSLTQSVSTVRQILSPTQDAPFQHDPEGHENDSPATPGAQSWREVSRTTTVPMLFTPAKAGEQPQPQPVVETETKEDMDAKSYPFDREAALAAIAYRRGRAKSFAQSHGTPKRPVIDRAMDRRDISAPALS